MQSCLAQKLNTNDLSGACIDFERSIELGNNEALTEKMNHCK